MIIGTEEKEEHNKVPFPAFSSIPTSDPFLPAHINV